jgi:acyl-CoA thioester hydrolase
MTEPVETYRSTVFPWHCDQFGHMNARWYAAHFDDASFHLYQRSGLSYGHMRKAGSIITVVAEIRIEYRHEMVAGDLLVIRSGFTRLGNKSLQRTAWLCNAEDDTLCAIEHARDVFFDEETRASAPMPDAFRTVLAQHLLPEGYAPS